MNRQTESASERDVEVQVQTRVLGHRKQNLGKRPIRLQNLPTPVTLAGLIEAVVRTEVQSFLDRAEERKLLGFLTATDIDEGRLVGKIVPPGAPYGETPEIDVEQAVAAALLANRDGLYQLLIDDVCVDDLDAEVDLSSGSELLFLRLVALVGG